MLTKRHELGFSEDLLMAAIHHDWILCGVEAAKARSVTELLSMIDDAIDPVCGSVIHSAFKTMAQSDTAADKTPNDKVQRRNTMKKWTVINQHDGNDTFEAEGDNYEEAACDALQQLGWAISIPKSDEDEDEDTPNAQISGGTPSAESDCSARGCHNCGHGHLGGWKTYRHWPCLTCRVGSGLYCGDDNWKPNDKTQLRSEV